MRLVFSMHFNLLAILFFYKNSEPSKVLLNKLHIYNQMMLRFTTLSLVNLDEFVSMFLSNNLLSLTNT